MNKNNKTFIFFLFLVLLSSEIFSKGLSQKKYNSLIFPDPEKTLVLVKANNEKSLMLSGHEATWDMPLAQKIWKELDFPFHRSIIKLNQCSRNFSSNTEGPNVLFLSQTQGGFPRTGLIIKDDKEKKEYPQLNYVDLVLDENRLERGDMEIFSHEFGHVMMNNIWEDFGITAGENLSPKQHVSMGVTDYYVAFYEGWGVHFQIFANEIDRYRDSFKHMFDYDRITGSLWHSNVDRELRITSVLQNEYIYQKLLPKGKDLGSLEPEQLILLEHTSTLFDKTRLKNAQQMLSCEGVIATLFSKFNSNTTLQHNYKDREFYDHFLLSPMPENINPQDILSPFENVILKNFWVWHQLKSLGNELQGKVLFIEFVKEWTRSYPEDRKEILNILLSITAGKTVCNELGKIYEEMAFYGLIGDIQKFRQFGSAYMSLYKEIFQKVLDKKIELDANVGPELWIKNEDFKIRTRLWASSPKKPLAINVNTASAYELSTFPDIDLETAEKIIAKRNELGFFRSLEEFHMLKKF